MAFRQIHKVLGMEMLPAPKFSRNHRFTRKRRRDNSNGEGNDSEGVFYKNEIVLVLFEINVFYTEKNEIRKLNLQHFVFSCINDFHSTATRYFLK